MQAEHPVSILSAHSDACVKMDLMVMDWNVMVSVISAQKTES